MSRQVQHEESSSTWLVSFYSTGCPDHSERQAESVIPVAMLIEAERSEKGQHESLGPLVRQGK